MAETKDKGFKVKDSRRFDERGEVKPGVSDGAPEDTAAAADQIDFVTFLLSLSSPGFYYLGEVPHPNTGKIEPDLALAKQTIDLLGLIEHKTRGNLTPEEGQVLTNVLCELRLKYVERSQGESSVVSSGASAVKEG